MIIFLLVVESLFGREILELNYDVPISIIFGVFIC